MHTLWGFLAGWLLYHVTSVSHSVMSNSLRPHGLQSTRLLCPWDFPGKDTGVGCHFLLQGILPLSYNNLFLPLFSVSLFLPSCRFLRHFLEFYFELSIVFSVHLFAVFLVAALSILLYIHSLSQTTGIIILPVQVSVETSFPFLLNFPPL